MRRSSGRAVSATRRRLTWGLSERWEVCSVPGQRSRPDQALAGHGAGTAWTRGPSRRILAPSGTLRAAINLGNPVLAQRDRADGPLTGVSVALAHEFARSLEDSARACHVRDSRPGRRGDRARSLGRCVPCGRSRARRRNRLHAALRHHRGLIHGPDGTRHCGPSGTWTVTAPQSRPARTPRYDLYLMRALKHAKLVHAPSSRAAIDLFLSGKTDVAAGIRIVRQVTPA